MHSHEISSGLRTLCFKVSPALVYLKPLRLSFPTQAGFTTTAQAYPSRTDNSFFQPRCSNILIHLETAFQDECTVTPHYRQENRGPVLS